MIRRTLAALMLVLVFGSSSSIAQETPAKQAKLRWFGQSFFQLETSAGKRIVFDPHAIPEFGRPMVSADLILCSHMHDDHTQLQAVDNAKSARVFNGLKEVVKGRPPEWNLLDEKIGTIRVQTVGTFHDADNGLQRGRNSIFLIEVDGLRFCHLGDLGHELSADQLRQIGKVDVLMIPVGGTYTINGEQAKAVVATIKPRLYIVPMHYGVPGYFDLNGPEEFLDQQKNISKMLGTNELVIPLALTAEQPTIALLNWRTLVPKK